MNMRRVHTVHSPYAYIPGAAYSAAGGLAGVDGVSLVDLDLSAHRRRARGRRAHARLDLRRHRHERLLDVR